MLTITEDSFDVDLLKSPLELAPGQSRPVTFHMRPRKPVVDSISFAVTYVIKGAPGHLRSPAITSALISRNCSEPHKITFLHPGSIASYAILRPPPLVSSLHTSPGVEKLPILLNLHGAGLEADSYQVRHMLDSVPDIPAWVLFPTGVTPWSGDDWRESSS